MSPSPDGSCPPSDAARPLLRRRHRLRSSKCIRETYDQGSRQVGDYMVLWVRNAGDSCCRLAVVASRKVGHAVKRNRAKRRIREVFRLHRHLLCSDMDLVIVCRYTTGSADWNALCEEFITLARRSGVLRADAGAS